MNDGERNARLGIAANRLLKTQHHSGAWGQRAESERGNTIATAQVLRILSQAGVPAGHEAVARARAYLAREALDHAREVSEGGRGPYTRYVAYSLAGLHAHGVPYGSGVRQARDAQIDWLLGRQIMGGWADTTGNPISTHSTAQALQALKQVGAPQEAIEAAVDYLLMTRSAKGYWQLEEFGPPSPALTAEAILALHGLDPPTDEALGISLDWLDSNRRLWLRQVERQPIAGEIWDHPSFALAELALAHHAGASAPIGVSLEYTEELWDPENQGWRFPDEVKASVKGTSSALLCFEAVSRAIPIDLAAAALAFGPRSLLAGSPKGTWQIKLHERPDAVVEMEGISDLMSLRPRLWDLLDAIAAESERANGGALRREHIGEAMGAMSRGTLSKEVTRLHEKLAAATGGRLREVVTSAGHGRWRLRGAISRRGDVAPSGSATQDRDGRARADD
jgi:hypothetical protein